MQLAIVAVGLCVYGLFVRVLTAKLDDQSPISRVIVPISVPVLLNLAKGDSVAIVTLASAFFVGWAHDEIVKLFSKLMRK